MRCCCCDAPLSDYESTLKHSVTGKYLDMCLKCLTFIKEGGYFTDNKANETEDGSVLTEDGTILALYNNNIDTIEDDDDSLYIH